MRSSKKRLLLLIAMISMLALSACRPVLPLNPRYAYSNIEINLGETIDASVEEFVDFSELSAEEQRFVKENTRLVVDGIETDGTTIDKAGKHSVRIEYCGMTYRTYSISIVDKEPPVFTKSSNIYTFKGLDFDETTLGMMFEAKDNSGSCDISLDEELVDCNKVGTYEVKAVATDPSGNQSEATAEVVVQNPKYGAKGTYVYVSIPNQTLTYFVNGKVELTTPVVTGNTNGHNTPRGTFRVNNKARSITLKGFEDNGDEYESYVNYWMSFIGSSIGLHDATWRSSFGGNIYMGGGSHGCVNMPLYMAGSLYEMIAIGTPVLVY